MSTWRPPGFMRVARSELNHSHNLSRMVSLSASSRRSHRIVDDGQISTEACNADATACRVVFAALGDRPPARCLAIPGQFNAECLAVLRNEIANLATEFIRKFARVRRCDDIC